MQQNNVRVASPCDCIFNLTIIAILLKFSAKYSVPVRALPPKPTIPPVPSTTGSHQLNVSATKPELLLPLQEGKRQWCQCLIFSYFHTWTGCATLGYTLHQITYVF